MKKFLAIILVTLITLTAVSAFATNNKVMPYYLNSNDTDNSWSSNETKPLLPGCICIGDVYVASTKRFDDGSGEDTVVVNLSQKPVTITAPYGAQLQRFTPASLEDLMFQLSLQEFGRTEEKNEVWQYSYHTIRFVIIYETGAIEQLPLLTRTEFFK